MNQNTNASTMMQLLAVTERGEGDNKKSFWTRIGVAFENRDGSWNLRFDFVPARMGETTIQMRPFNPREEGEGDGEEQEQRSRRPDGARTTSRRNA
jgi:hypothetical protein